MLCACQKTVEKQLEELTYTDEEIAKIMELDEIDQKRFLEQRDLKMTGYLMMNDFKEEKL